MSGVEALARVLAAADGLEDGLSIFPLRMTRYWSSAQAILADPGPLLAALAEAGVLKVDHVKVHSRPVIIVRRYVTEWRADD